MRAAVLGASGYTGGELLRLIALHPELELVYATSREYVGYPVYYVHRGLKPFYPRLRFERLNLDRALEADVVFSALPAGAGLKIVADLYEHGVRVIDLSPDYRLRDPEAYRVWYGFEHPYPDLLSKAVYGFPEAFRERLRGAKLVAVPGCNATAALLASLPLARAGIGDGRLLVDVKAASSEAGSKPRRADHHPEREGSIRPYSPGGHRHAVEVEQALREATGREIVVSLVPHAVPAVRGAFASAHVWAESVGEEEVARAYAEAYASEPFVNLVAPPRLPDVKSVVGSNYAEVGYAVEERVSRVTGFAAIDNLVKGAAGQAIQSLNVALGLPEEAGLRIPPLTP